MTTLDRTQSPSFRLSSDYSLTSPEIIPLSNGVKLFALRGGQLEVVKLELIFDSAKWVEDKPGVSHFTFQMLSRGTHNRNAFQFAEALDSLGTYLEIHSGYDFASIAIFTLRKHLFEAIRLLTEMISVPAFDDQELRIMKEIFTQNLKVNNEKNDVVASKEIRRALFGEHHPYGSSVEEPDVQQLTSEDINTFFTSQLSLHSVFFVGQLSDHELVHLAELIPPFPPAKKRHASVGVVQGSSLTISKEGSVQASLRLGKKCLPKSDHEEYFDALMCNHILGGFFGSRLMKTIREEKGLTYGIHSSLNHLLHESFWVIGAEVNHLNAEAAVNEIKKEILKLQETPLPLDELEVAKNYFIGSWQSENATLFAIADKIKGLYLAGLPDNFYSRLLGYFRSMEPAAVRAAAIKHFGAADLIEVRVG